MLTNRIEPVGDPYQLVGGWRLNRTIDDRMSGQRGCVHGTLTITPTDAGLAWFESGVLNWAGQQLEVTRRLRINDVAGSYWVQFADGRAFHPWSPGSWVTHPCSLDLYRGLISIDGSDRFRITWQVTGPTKDHTITSRLHRQANRQP
jgi:uncharacterized protein DUF6314